MHRHSEPPGILNVLHLVPAPAQIPDREQVEPIGIARATMPQPPDHRHLAQDVALERAHGLASGPAHVGAPRLYLHEGDEVILPRHQVEVVPTHAEAMRFDVPAAGCEIGDGGALAGHAAALAPISPIADGYEAASGSHGPRIGATRGAACTDSARSRTKFRVTRASAICSGGAGTEAGAGM